MDKVYFVENYNELPDRIREYMVRGWAVYNAPRPLSGDERWQGDFRRGVFYAAVDLADQFKAPLYEQTNCELDAGICEIITRATILAHGQEVANECGVDLSELDYADIVMSYLDKLEREAA